MIGLLWIGLVSCRDAVKGPLNNTINPVIIKKPNNSSKGTNSPIVIRSNAPFLECLSKTGARFLSPSSSNYSNVTTGFNYRFHNKPVAIIYPTSDILVQQAVRCAVTNRIMITPRSGGHSHEVLLHI
jgi:hypothetical protein